MDTNYFEDFVPCHTNTNMVPAEGSSSVIQADTANSEDPYMSDAPPSGMSYMAWWGNNMDEAEDG